MLPSTFTSRRVPFWYHDTSGEGNPLATQVSCLLSNRVMLVSTGSTSRMGFTGGMQRRGTALQ